MRAYNVSGSQVGRVESLGDPDADRAGALGDMAGIAVQGVEAETQILVSRRGHRRHALFLLAPGVADGRSPLPKSLPPGGDTHDTFRNLAGVALAGDRAFACEAGTGTIQVFRGGEFHFRMALPGASDRARRPGGCPRLEPRLVSPLPDGRIVVACGGESGSALLLLDGNGGLCSTLAEEGTEEGQVHLPTGLAVEEGPALPTTRIAVLDRDADRIQAFTLDGRCYGSFLEPREMELRRRGRGGEKATSGGRAGVESAPAPD